MPKGNREAADCLSTVGVPLNAATMLAQAITLYKHGSESRKGELEPLERLKRSERELHYSTIQTAAPFRGFLPPSSSLLRSPPFLPRSLVRFFFSFPAGRPQRFRSLLWQRCERTLRLPFLRPLFKRNRRSRSPRESHASDKVADNYFDGKKTPAEPAEFRSTRRRRFAGPSKKQRESPSSIFPLSEVALPRPEARRITFFAYCRIKRQTVLRRRYGDTRSR